MMEARFLLTDTELDTLHGAGPLAFMVYVLLRSWMDYTTGKAGATRPLSLAMLATYTESHTPRGAGYQVERPSEKAIRTALARLQRAGLARRLPGDGLVFKLPLAVTASARPFQTGQGEGTGLSTEPGTVPAGPTTKDGKASAALAGANPARVAGVPEGRTGHTSGVHVLLTSTDPAPLLQTLSAAGLPVLGQLPTVQRWADQGTTPSQVLEAIAKARAVREKAGSRQPLNVGLLDAILTTPSTPPHYRPARSHAPDDTELLHLGTARGLTPRPGESWQGYRQRVSATGAPRP